MKEYAVANDDVQMNTLAKEGYVFVAVVQGFGVSNAVVRATIIMERNKPDQDDTYQATVSERLRSYTGPTPDVL